MWDAMENDSCDTCEFAAREKYFRADMDDQFLCLAAEPVEEDSLYDTNSTVPTCGLDQSPHCPNRRSLVDVDASTQDSGYAAGEGLSSSFGSASMLSIEDFMEDFTDIEPLEKAAVLPNDFSQLLTEVPRLPRRRVSPKTTFAPPHFRRSISLQNPVKKVCINLFGLEDNKENKYSGKRPEPPTASSGMVKRSKVEDGSMDLFKRQFSATDESIMCAVQRSTTEPDLIGDFTRNYSLPLTNGRHQDLKSITPDTLARLMRGEFTDSVASFRVIDCRYPYEFIGGHIDGAVNMYTKEQISELLLETRVSSSSSQKRHILVFHCEFSSERGPNLYRFLRKEDRTRNLMDYPLLHYPEIYLLEGGYKSFFQQYSDMCVPVAYKQMVHPDHEEDLRHFRQKSKTFNADTRPKPSKRTLKRL